MLRIAATCLGLLGLLVLLDVFAVPSVIELVERFKILDEELLIRVHIVFPLIVLGLFLGLWFLHTPPGKVRQQILLLDLVVAIAFLLFVLLADHNRFIAEASRIAYFTSVALILASVCAFLNYLYHTYVIGSGLMLRAAWAVLGMAFFFAALDEMLSFHEKVGGLLERSSLTIEGFEDTGDLVTLAYGIGGLVIGIALLRFFRREFIKKGHYFYVIFLVAAGIYAASTLLDSFDFFLAPLSTELDLVFLANAIEEIFEYTAANLFLVAFLVALLESNDFALLKRASALLTAKFKDRPVLRYAGYAVGAGFLLASALVALMIRPDHELIREADRFQVDVFAGSHNGLARPDGIFYRGDHLYVATKSDVGMFGPDGAHTVLGDATMGLETPESIVVSADGTIYLTDDTRNEVLALRDGRAERMAGTSDGLRSVKGLAFDPDGNIYVSDTKAAAVFRYQDGGLSVYASTLQGISVPEEMAFDAQRNLYITEEKQAHIIKVTPEGKASVFADQSSGLRSPESITIHGDYVYVTDSKKGAIFRFDLAGKGGPLIRFGNRYRNLEGITFDDEGSIYVASRRNDPIPSVIFKITERAAHDVTLR